MSGSRDGLMLREAGAHDDAAIAALLAAAYDDNPKADAALRRWQYWDNPFGDARAWIWEEAGKAVAHWAAIPVPLVLNGQACVGVKTADAATHPGYRRRGLFGELARRYMDELRAAAVPAVLTHPNPDSAPGVAGSGAQLVARVPVYVRALADDWLAERLRLPSAAASALRRSLFKPSSEKVHEVAQPPHDVDALWAAVDQPWGIRRDAAWWRWRYQERPGEGYRFVETRRSGRLVAAAALRARDAFGARFCYVMELLAVDAEAARTLTASLDQVARDLGAVGLAALGIPGSRAARLAQLGGFRRLPRVLEPNPLRFMVLDPRADSAAGSVRLARQPWTISWGDLDHL